MEEEEEYKLNHNSLLLHYMNVWMDENDNKIIPSALNMQLAFTSNTILWIFYLAMRYII